MIEQAEQQSSTVERMEVAHAAVVKNLRLRREGAVSEKASHLAHAKRVTQEIEALDARILRYTPRKPMGRKAEEVGGDE